MSIIGSNILAGASGQATGAYEIERSLRFNSSDSAFCARTPGTAGNRKTFTWAGWVKRAKVSNAFNESYFFSCIFSPNNSDSNYFRFGFTSDNLFCGLYDSALSTAAVYRDFSAWYHVVLAVDTTQATASNRLKLYVNGSEITAFSSASYPIQNTDLAINSTNAHHLGYTPSATYGHDGYLADIHFIDGQALTPSSFTEVSATTGQLVPIAYAGTYTGNSFWLKFNDNSATTATTLGKDSFLLGNNWTPNNLSTSTGGPTSVAAASGALPVYNTTDTYGTTKGTGTRTDSNSSSIVLAIPMDGANNGTTFTDESATIKGSGSAKSITRNGDTKTVTTESKFYGSSGYFDGTGDYLSASNVDFAFGTADFTVECWVRVSALAEQNFIATRSAGSTSSAWSLAINSSGTLYVYTDNLVATSTTPLKANTWSHVATSRSGTTLRLFVDGIQVGSATNSQNFTVQDLAIGHSVGGAQFPLTGYMQDARLYKGVAKYTGSFNPPSATANATVAAGNDSLVDTPTSFGTDTGTGGEVRGNYCTLNPLGTAGAAPTNGNLSVSSSSTVGNRISTFFLTSGKWYWEGVGYGYVGAIVGRGGEGWTGSVSGTGSKAIGWWPFGPVYWDGGDNGGGTTYTSTDVIGVALDMDAGNVKFYKNGSLTYTITFGSGTVPNLSTGVFPAYNNGSGSSYSVDLNFGQRPFAYTAPSGFKALCDTNLPAPLVALPNTLMDVLTWTGNGASSRSLTGLNFSPDFAWIKRRNSAAAHTLWDSVRGLGSNKELSSSDTAAEGTTVEAVNYGYVSSLDSNGLTVNVGAINAAYVNTNNDTYVGWTWDAGSSTVTNTQGSISSQVRANASAGFSIVTYTGTGATGGTVGHGLGVAPGMIIIKNRDRSIVWVCYHSGIGSGSYLLLNTTDAKTDDATYWGAGIASTTFGVQANNFSGINYLNERLVAYCFAPVAGYSSLGSYVGNGSSDGPFVYTGFRPRWILFKKSSASQNWHLIDTARDPYNIAGNELYPDLSLGESGGYGNVSRIDVVSNGFKIRTSNDGYNGSAGTYIYIAFAENPFQYSRAR